MMCERGRAWLTRRRGLEEGLGGRLRGRLPRSRVSRTGEEVAFDCLGFVISRPGAQRRPADIAADHLVADHVDSGTHEALGIEPLVCDHAVKRR